jgi:fibronectin type 3 domain-containing protein
MNSSKDHKVLTIIITLLVLAGCFFALAPSVIRAADVPPGPPTGLAATAGDGQVSLSWTAPVDGGDSVDYYVVHQDTADLSEHFTGTSAVITGLTNGQSYTFSVAAYNESGLGSYSAVVTSTPMATTVPGVPTGLTATPGDGQVALSWTAPSNDGGATIDHYVVYQDGVALGDRPTATSATITGLTNGQQYSFAVAAHNSAGEGAQTSAVQVTPGAASTAPGAPTNLQATAGNGYVTLSWAAPSSDGGSAITGYKVYRGTSSGGETLLATIGNVLTYTDDSVTNGATYYYTVSASNSVEEGPQSDESSATPVASSTVPSAPLALASAAGNGQAVLSWTAPSSDGGSTIDYYVIYRNGADAGHITGTSTTVSGLINGQQYSFAVAAHNSMGIGPRSTAVTVTPGSDITVPGAPTGLSAAPGDGQITLSWTAPSDDGGAAIDYYIVYQNGVDVAHPTSTSFVITGLTNGQSYRFMVAAHNTAGTSAMTTSKVATPGAGDNMLWLLVGAAVLIGAAGAIIVFMMWRKRAASPPDEPPSPRYSERPPETRVTEAQAPPTPARVTTPLIEQLDVANDPKDPPEPPAPSRITTPMIDRLDTAKEAESSILCPRCGRPNSGRTKCQFCGKKLK